MLRARSFDVHFTLLIVCKVIHLGVKSCVWTPQAIALVHHWWRDSVLWNSLPTFLISHVMKLAKLHTSLHTFSILDDIMSPVLLEFELKFDLSSASNTTIHITHTYTCKHPTSIMFAYMHIAL